MKPWLDSYQQGVPEFISVDEFHSVADIFDQSVEKYAELPAFSNFGHSLSFREISLYSSRLAAYLLNDLKLKKGERVAVMMPNLLQSPIAIFAILRAGLVVVNINPLYTARELSHQLNDAEADTIIIVDNFCHVLQKVVADTAVRNIIVTRMGDMLPFPKSTLMNLVVKYLKRKVPTYHLPGAVRFIKALKRGAQHRFSTVPCSHEDIAFLQYTGGTTGPAKGAVLTHKNMVANMQQASAWIKPSIGDQPKMIITALPLYHIFSLTANCLTFIKHGWINYLITNPRDIDGFVKEIRNLKFAAITGVNTLFNGLLNHPEFKHVDFSRLMLTLGGGMSIQRSVAQRWKQVTGVTLIEAYGLTETSPAACVNPMNLEEFNGMIGLPISSTEVSIQDDEWNELKLGDTGEICIRGPQVMRGYWKRPHETDNVLSADGWLHSGDVGVMNEQGFVKLVDRIKDMIQVSGFNVYPSEIEDVIAEMEGVADVGVVGAPDEKSGETVMAVVVKKDPALTEETITNYCRENLTGYKVPKIIHFTDELPRTHVGKVLRRELRNRYIES